MLKKYKTILTQAEAEIVEKKSRFIATVRPVKTEEEAKAFIEEMKKKYYDARHNCWCYLLGGSVVRYSDDGEPQGTAGQPMLAVFQREHVTNVLCVVTRYFGGILLGIIENLSKAYISTQLSDAIVFLVLVVVLIVKPTGLLGKKVNVKV